jgi:acyl-CoA thioester hydrolase
MPRDPFFHPVEIRYADIDAQGHVNNAKYLTYMEQARVAYIMHLELWDGRSYLDTGMVLADARVSFRLPIRLHQKIEVGIRTTRLGRKSITMTYEFREQRTGTVFATGETVIVTYDYRAQQSIPIPPNWRATLENFEQFAPAEGPKGNPGSDG